MTKTYPDYENPAMIYNDANEFTIIDGSQVEAALAAGWQMTHSASIHHPLKEYVGNITFDLEPAEANPAVVTMASKPAKKHK